jgi:hypothetical protein
MNNQFNPAEYNEQYENAYISNQDFKIFTIPNIITDFQKMKVYDNVKKMGEDAGILQKFAGHKAWSIKMPYLEKYLNSVLSKHMDEDMVLVEYSFARYSPQYGYNCKLFPHFDTHNQDGQRVTLDIKLNSNIEWGVVVEEKTYHIKNNDALVFSGTQQIHWRENINLKPKDQVDMIFCHFQYANNRPWDKDQKQILEYRSHRFREKTGISNQPEEYVYD